MCLHFNLRINGGTISKLDDIDLFEMMKHFNFIDIVICCQSTFYLFQDVYRMMGCIAHIFILEKFLFKLWSLNFKIVQHNFHTFWTLKLCISPLEYFLFKYYWKLTCSSHVAIFCCKFLFGKIKFNLLPPTQAKVHFFLETWKMWQIMLMFNDKLDLRVNLNTSKVWGGKLVNRTFPFIYDTAVFCVLLPTSAFIFQIDSEMLLEEP